MLHGILHYAHYLLESTIEKDETVIDATCGNGKDTLFLSNVVGANGHVLAFDIQAQAIQTTKQLMEDHQKTNVSVIHDSHENLEKYLPTKEMLIGGAVFNLGYLPKSDKSIITNAASTISAINTILHYLKTNGLIVIVVYYGHQGGQEEKEAVLKHVMQLSQRSYHVLQYRFINQKNNPPFIIAIEKRKRRY
ncbi:tRNA (mnm(5)s(2)U34)-methyltransferase [Virgibacillus pantothenticus]|uniref:tRNA (mnm(5)s(2)U34)-methyltransferase n=1 Tax=Virgibacillus pantothenticus TaxID=1473 RepID=UPI00098517A0|nr:class I SAM-dependent methyltransferase [Virgibacillus pantothenticus]